MPDAPFRVVLTRGGLPESQHRVRVAVWRHGQFEREDGDVEEPVFLRSSAKLFQAMASVVTGAAERFRLTDAELALACGSHGAEAFHVETARGILRKIGLGPEHLLCGSHWPSYEPASRLLAREAAEPSNLHNNCSGKHSNMLAACVAMGWPTEDYVAFTHPLQKLNVDHLASFAGLRPCKIHLAVDGCSAPNFALPLSASARAFAHFGTPDAADGVAEGPRNAARRIAAALAKHPEMIGGTRRLDTDLIRVTGGRVLSKMGAEGVWCISVVGDDLGIAIKAEDGASRAAYPVGLSVLRSLGVLSDVHWEALSAYHDPVLRNHRRLEVGRVEVHPPTGA